MAKKEEPVVRCMFDPEGEELVSLLKACFRDYLAVRLRETEQIHDR